jgi:hypothetical protein
MNSITSSTPVKQYGYGNNFIEVPVDAYSFGKRIEMNQEQIYDRPQICVLFNKGRYFEATLPKSIINEVAELIKTDISYNTMIVGSWRLLEDFVVALNCVGYRANITIDWI